MKRTLITMLAAMFAASGASAATLLVDTDSDFYLLNDLITITATFTSDGSETAGFGQGIGFSIQWDDTIANPDNEGDLFADGHGTQLVTSGPNAGASQLSANGGSVLFAGPANTGCNNNGYACEFLTQTNTSFSTVTLDAQTLVATLVLRAEALGDLNLATFSLVNTLSPATDVTFGTNLQNAVVPEPTTAALLGLGLLGLGVAGRRR